MGQLLRALVVTGVLGLLVGFGASFAISPRYEAHTDVLISPAPGARAQDATDERLLASYATLISGRRVAAAARDETGTRRSVTDVDDDLHGEVLGDSSIIRVTARQGDPGAAAALSRAAAAAFVDQLVSGGIALDPDASDTADEARPGLTATVVEESPTPTSAASPSRLRWAIVGLLVGAVLGVALAAARSLTDRRFRTVDELSEVTDAPVLATVGFDRRADATPLVSDLPSGHPRLESARILRTALQFLDVDQTQSVYTITSSVPDEGKSTVASNVAIALARGGESVALVEGDLRLPRLAELFDLSDRVGLTSVLVGRASLDRALQDTSVPGLAVLTSGPCPPNPAELLQTDAMADLVATLASEFDVVLFDAPPLLPVTDAAVLATLSSGAVLVVRHGRTTRDQVRTALDRLEAVGAPLLGTVLTMVPARASGDAYGYGYADEPPTAPREEGRRVQR